MKRLLSLLVLLVLLTGCGPVRESADSGREDLVRLRYYTIGRADPDLALVNDALNELLAQRYGFTVDYQKIDWNDYESTTNGILNTDQNFDILFTWDTNYVRHAGNGAFLELGEYLSGEGSRLYDAVDPRLWHGVRLDGGIYGVPTNKELAPVVQFLFSSYLVEKYSIDIDAYPTIESLEPLLEWIAQQEPDVIPLMFTSERVNLSDLLGFEYVAGADLPLVVRSGDPGCRVENIYETQEMIDLQNTLRRFYQKGLINADATVRTAISRFRSEQVFCRIATGGPESEASFSVDFGYPIVCRFAGTPWITNTSTRGGIMAVNAHTEHPREALAFLSAVNLDPDVRNLLNYGVEGVHYTLNADDQVEVISDRYRGVPYTQGNWYILKTMAGEDPDKWQRYREYNREAQPSVLLGFQPDLSTVQDLCREVSGIYGRFDNALLTGSVDPEIYRAKALEQMEKAGIDDLITLVQSQVDLWKYADTIR